MIYHRLITKRGVRLQGLNQESLWFIHIIFDFYNDTIFMYGQF